MISKMGYSKRGEKLSSCPGLLQPRAGFAAAEPGSSSTASESSLRLHWPLGTGVAGKWLLVQDNCSGAVADAKAGFKAEMDAPGWQREREEGGREGTGLRGAWQLAGSSGSRRQHTWSLQAAGDQSVAWPPPQGRCPHTELHVISQPAAFPGLDEKPAHISLGLLVSCGSELFTAQETQSCCLLLPQSSVKQPYDTWVHCK